MDKKLYLNVGCGKLHEESTDEIKWINIDKCKEVNPDLTCDFKFGLPYEDNEVDHIKAMACLGQIESNDDFKFVMNEFHRILKLSCKIWIYLPHKDFPHAYIDPFNQRRFNELSWQAFDQTHKAYIDHLSYYGFKPWKDVTVKLNTAGFLIIWMTKP